MHALDVAKKMATALDTPGFVMATEPRSMTPDTALFLVIYPDGRRFTVVVHSDTEAT